MAARRADWGSFPENNSVSVELQRFYSLSHRLKAVPAPSKRGSQGVVHHCKRNDKLKFELLFAQLRARWGWFVGGDERRLLDGAQRWDGEKSEEADPGR